MPPMVNTVHTSVKVGVWNVDGLNRRIGGQSYCKLDDADFQKELGHLDIIGLIETHLNANVDPPYNFRVAFWHYFYTGFDTVANTHRNSSI